MSFVALAWASKYRAASAAEKLVLLAYADRHSEDTGHAYPSIAWLEEFCSLNRKTIITAVMKLEAAGILADTGERKGSTRQIKVYSVNLQTVPKAEQFQKRNSTVLSRKQSQKRDTDTVREPIPQKATPSSEPRVSKPKPHRLSDDWKPIRFSESTVARSVVDQRGGDWARAALESFRNWAANAEDRDGVGRKVDWQRAWANWIIEQDKRDGRHGTGKPNSQQGLRGSRPDPAFDMYQHAIAREAEENSASYREADRGAGLPLPSYLTG